jgi:hypothetical protein
MGEPFQKSGCLADWKHCCDTELPSHLHKATFLWALRGVIGADIPYPSAAGAASEFVSGFLSRCCPDLQILRFLPKKQSTQRRRMEDAIIERRTGAPSFWNAQVSKCHANEEAFCGLLRCTMQRCGWLCWEVVSFAWGLVVLDYTLLIPHSVRRVSDLAVKNELLLQSGQLLE